MFKMNIHYKIMLSHVGKLNYFLYFLLQMVPADGFLIFSATTILLTVFVAWCTCGVIGQQLINQNTVVK